MIGEYKFDPGFKEIFVYMEMGRYEESIKKINELFSEYANDERLFFLLAYCHYNMGIYDKAVEYCEESMKLGFSLEECNYLLGNIYMNINQFPQAERNFIEALRINPQNVKVLASYSMLMLKTGYNDKAYTLIQEAMKIDPDNDSVLNCNLMYYMCQEDEDNQTIFLQRYIENASSEMKVLIKIGIYNLYNNERAEAHENFRQAFLMDPTNKGVLSILENLDRKSHIVFLPNRIIDKIGGPKIVYIAFMAIILLGKKFINSVLLIIIVSIYILFAIYTWISPLIYRAVLKFKN